MLPQFHVPRYFYYYFDFSTFAYSLSDISIPGSSLFSFRSEYVDAATQETSIQTFSFFYGGKLPVQMLKLPRFTAYPS